MIRSRFLPITYPGQPYDYDAQGADFIVPSGYKERVNPYPLFVGEGERVQVTPAGQPGNNGGGGLVIENININAAQGQNGYQLYQQFKQALEADMRAAGRSGISYADA